jgi:hypothetical protein
MATRDRPLDPQEALAAAEAAHLAARRSVPVRRIAGQRVAGWWVAGWWVAGWWDGRLGGGTRADRRLDRSRAGPVRPDRERAAGSLHGPAGAPASSARGAAGTRRAPLPLAAAVAAGWAAAVSFAPVAALIGGLRAAETGFAVSGPIRLAGAAWLLAHGVPVHTPDGPVGLVPLLLTVLAAWRVSRAGVHVTRVVGARRLGPLRQAGLAATAIAASYGLIGALVAALSGGPGWGPPVVRAGLTLAGFGFLAAGYGSLRATGVLAAWRRRLPLVLRAGVRAGLMAASLVVAAGAALAGAALAAAGGSAADILAAYRTTVAGQAGLTLVCLAYAPNLAGWAAAYLVGPGFAVGSGSVVRSSEVTLGWLPPLPVFAGLPDGPLPTLGAVLLAVPVVTGAAGGWWLARRLPGWGPVGFGTLVSGVVAGGLLGLVAAVSGGPLGGGQLASFGPDPLPVAGLVAATVTAGAVLGAVASATTARRRGGPTAAGIPARAALRRRSTARATRSGAVSR